MDRKFSLYLELSRFLAAVGVLLYHGRGFVAPWLPPLAGALGDECVAVFFVLSGFVIRFVTATREHDLRQYAAARFARLYSVVPLAILAGLGADALGRHFDPAAYAALAETSRCNGHTSALDVLSYLAFVNELWGRHLIVGCQEPYWSLGFEAMYYLAFGIALFAKGWRRIVGLAAWVFATGLPVVAFMPLWLMGAGLFDLLPRLRLSRRAAWAVLVLSLALLALVRAGLKSHGVMPMFAAGATMPRRLAEGVLYFHLIGALICAHLVAVAALLHGRRWSPGRLDPIVRWLAGASFTLYLCHEPILIAARAVIPSVVTRPALGLGVILVTLAICFGLAELGERRKALFRQLLQWRPAAVGAARAQAEG